MKFIKPFSFHELFSLVKEVDKSGEIMDGKDIIMLLGTTGSGKSTTVHYLAGSKMRLVRVNGIPHYEPAQIYNPDLQNVICSWRAKSETRYVTPITNCHRKKNIIIADTPGSEDTQSAEIEFANILGVKNAIGKAESVRPVILFSYRNVGDRQKKLKELMHYYASLFEKIDTYVERFTYVFTNVTEGDAGSRGTILPQLLNIQHELNSNEQNDKVLQIMLDDMIEKAKNQQIIELNPLDYQQRELILNHIISLNPIPYPGEVIRQKVSQHSQEIVKNQINFHQKAIQKALSLNRVDIISFKLNELLQFIDILTEDKFYQDKYQECLQIIHHFLENKYESATKAIAEGFKVRANLTQNNADIYLAQYNDIKKFDECVSKFMKQLRTKQSEDYLTALNQILCENLSELIQQNTTICNRNWFYFIIKLDYFKIFKSLPFTKQEIINLYLQKLQELSENCQKLLNNQTNNQTIILIDSEPSHSISDQILERIGKSEIISMIQFDQKSSRNNNINHIENSKSSMNTSFTNEHKMQFEFSKCLSEIQKAQQRAIKYKCQDLSYKISIAIQNVHQAFNKYLLNLDLVFDVFKDYENPLKFTEQDIQNCQEKIDFMNHFLLHFNNFQLTEISDILTKYKKSLQDRLENVMDKFIEFIQKFLSNIDKPLEIERMFKQMKLLQQLTIFQASKIEAKLYLLFISISNYIRVQDEKITVLFQEIKTNKKSDLNILSKFNRALKILKQMEWFDKQHQYSNFKETLQNIEEIFQQHAQQLQIELKWKKIQLKDLDNLKQLALAKTEINQYQEILRILDIKLQESNEIDEKISQVQEVIKLNEKTLTQYETRQALLSKQQLKFITDFHKYLEIIEQYHSIFCPGNSYNFIINRIQGQDNIFAKQYKYYLDGIENILLFIKLICNQQQVEDQTVNITKNLEMLHTILQIIKDLELNEKEIFQLIDCNQNLIQISNDKINQILEVFRNLGQNNVQQNVKQFRVSYEILSRLVFIDQYTQRLEFTTEFNKWKELMIRTPTENIKKLHEKLKSNDYHGINLKVKQIEQLANHDEYENSLLLIRQEVQFHLQILDQLNKYDEAIFENVMQNIIKSAQVLQEIGKFIDEKYLPSNIKIQEKISSITNKLLKLANEQLSKSQNFIKLKSYASSFKCIEISNIIKQGLRNSSILDDSAYQKLEESIKNESTQLEEKVLSEIESYKTLDLHQFLCRSPKLLYLNLEKIKDEEQRLVYQNKLKENVMGKLNQELHEVVKLLDEEYIDTEKSSKRISKYEMMKNVIPSEWWEEDMTIIDVKSSLEERIQQETDLICQIINSNNLNIFIQLLEKNPKLCKKQETIQWFNKQLRDELKICEEKLESFATLQDGIQKLIQVDSYKTQRSAVSCIQKDINDQFINLTRKIGDLIHQTTQNLLKQFDEQYQKSSHFGSLPGQEREIFLGSFDQQFNNEPSLNIKNLSILIESLLFDQLKDRGLNKNVNSNLLEYYQISIQKSLEQINKNANIFLRQQQDKIQINKDGKLKLDTNVCQKAIIFLFRVDKILTEIRKENIQMHLTLGLTQEFLKSEKKLTDEIKNKISEIILEINEKFNGIELITQKSIQSGLDRKDHFSQIQNMINTLEIIINFGDEINGNITQQLRKTKQRYEEDINKNIINLGEQILEILRKSFFSLDKEAMIKFEQKLEHIQSLEQYFTIFKNIIQDYARKIDSQIDEQILKQYSISEECIDDLDQFSKNLQNLQRANQYCPSLRVQIKAKIQSLLKAYKNNANGDTAKITFLANVLIKSSEEGARLVADFNDFDGVSRAIWNQKVQRIDIQQVLQELRGDNIDNKKLLSRFNQFKKIYENQVEESLTEASTSKKIDKEKIISNIIAMTDKTRQKLTQIEIDKLPNILALIFSLWTLLSADYYFESDELDQQRKLYLKMPHAAQIVSIFRIMGIGYTQFEEQSKNPIHKMKSSMYSWIGTGKNRIIADNLAQIKTGEGKSITLAAVSAIFALFGFEVRIACYSEYLSNRDFLAFQDLFNCLGIQESIKYGTFNQACEAYLNQDGNIRDLYLSKIVKGMPSIKRVKHNNKPCVLLIDEVDVFFSKDFFGAEYRPQASIQHPTVRNLIDYIWQNKDNEMLMKLVSIKRTQQFIECQNIFEPIYAPLLEEAVKDMISDLLDFHNHDYIEEKGLIGYKDQDQINYDISYGYKTLFAYYQKHQEGKVTNDTLKQQKAIGINVGVFSYAEIPKNYSMVLGVTGTLEQLTQSEKNIIKDVYNIKNFTYLPSVYGNSQLLWEPKENVLITNNSRYYHEIITEINRKMKNNTRAVIVFFVNDKKLQNFLDSQQFKDQCYSSYQVLNERLQLEEKEDRIKMASQQGQVTLSTRSYGRGADFICKDTKVEEAGGVHVLLTFFSRDVSEEAQLMGRTARQGNPGSISMILLLEDLSEFNFMEEDLQNCTRAQYYEKLCEHRIHQQSALQNDETKSLKEKLLSHQQATSMYKAALSDSNDEEIFKFLKKINLGRSSIRSCSDKVIKTLIMMDATGSMGSLINKTKNAVSTMFQDASQILTEKNIDSKLFEIQFGCYRNYSSSPQTLLQYSSWECKPEQLKKFMETIQAREGWGQEEAVEIGLWHANQEAETLGEGQLSQVFIIGDAPPNTEKMVLEKRSLYSENFQKTKFSEPTNYKKEIEKLKAKKIPVFTFYVHDYAKAGFQEIAYATGGKCQFLDVESDQGQRLLIELFVSQILFMIGNENGGKGEEFVKAYKAYKKSQ